MDAEVAREEDDRDAHVERAQARISAATPCIPARRGTTSSTLSRAQYGMSASSSGPVVDQVAAAARGAERLLGRRVRRRQPHRRLGGVAAVVTEEAGDPAGHVAVVERERALDAGAEDRDVVAVRRAPPR